MDNGLIPPAMDDTDVWDELSNQQSKEIQQHLRHHRGVMMTNSYGGGGGGGSSFPGQGPLLVTVPRMVQDTMTRIRSAASAAATSLRQPHHSHDPSLQQPMLSEFGIPDDPLLAPQRTPGGTTASHSKNEFIFLNNFRILPPRDGWGAVSNLDMFFSSLYNYYYHRGFMPIVSKGVVELVSLFVTLWLSVFLFACVDWKALFACHDEATCHPSFRDYMVEKPFFNFTLWNFIVILYCVLFACYSVFSVWSFCRTLGDAWEAKCFFEDKLGIAAQRLAGGAVDWDKDVVSKLMELQKSGDYRIAIHGQGELDALVIAQRILRKENFLVAFFNRPLLDLQLPFLSSTTFYSKSLEWSLYFCVLNYMFNHKYEIRPAFLDPSALQRRFILCGIVHAVFMPFLLFFMTLHFSMQNLYDWKSTKQYLGPREWSLSAKWTFREFNELPHFFERRMGPSYEATEDYLKLFVQSELMSMLGRILAFVGGSFGVVLLAFGAINDAILLHVKIGDWNLLWYVGVMGVLYSTGKSMLPNPKVHPTRYTRNLFAEMDLALAKVATHSHYYPDVWKGRGYDPQTQKAVSSMFQFKAQLFVMEIVSVIVAPLLLCWTLPQCAYQICDFVYQTKATVPGAGEVCGYSTFDFDSFSDDHWEGKTAAASIVSDLTESAMHPLGPPKAWHGKMEKSFFNFKACHASSWKSTKSGQTLVDLVEGYKERALAHEQQHHMAAAARQLDTLALLEQTTAAATTTLNINETYLQADAGAGSTTTSPRVQDHRSRLPPQREEPPFALNESSPNLDPTAVSVLHYADDGLSMELRRVLHGTVDATATTPDQPLDATRDYLWLQRYHSSLAEQPRQSMHRSAAV